MRTLLVALMLAGTLPAQVAGPANSAYQTKEGREQIASGLGGPDRDARQKPRQLVSVLELKQGMAVVDLGTGPGYMLPYLSEAVGPGGTVIAEDIQQDFLDKARDRARKAGLGNVNFVLGTDTDPKLPAGSADLIFILDAYHHFDYPDQMLAKLRAGLRPGGRMAIVEYYKRRGAMEGDPDRPLTHIRLDAGDLVKEVEANGFRLLKRMDHIPGRQYIASFAMK